MPFDYAELMKELYPAPKPGEWVPCDYGLPKEFELVVFAADDRSAEGMLYLGYREGREFLVMYGGSETAPFPIGGSDGVGFWSPLPERTGLFAHCALHNTSGDRAIGSVERGDDNAKDEQRRTHD